MKKGLILHYIIGIAAAILVLAAAYYINQNPKNLLSAGIIILAGCLVAFSQYQIIKQKKKQWSRCTGCWTAKIKILVYRYSG